MSERCSECAHAAHGPGRCSTPSVYGCRNPDCAFTPTMEEVTAAWAECAGYDSDLAERAQGEIHRFVAAQQGKRK